MKKLFTLFLTLFVASSVWAYDFVSSGIYYSIVSSTEKTVKVTYKSWNSNSYSGNITIPSSVTYNGITYRVMSIGYQAFYNCTSLSSVTIPESVTTIEGRAFCGCTNLSSVSIPQSVTSIGDYAFGGDTKLASITIPESVISIGQGAFYNCTGVIFTIDGIKYNILNNNSVEVVTNNYSGDIVIPSSVTFDNPYVVVGIAESAFSGCTGLKSITIPESVTSIGSEAFSGCTGLTSITIPVSVTSSDVLNSALYVTKDGIRYHVLDNNSVEVDKGSGDIVIPASITAGNTFAVVGIGYSAFGTGLTSITIPESVTSIKDNSFFFCNLTSIIIKSNVDFSRTYLYFIKDNVKYHVLNKNSVEVVSNKYSGDIVIPASVTAGNTFAVVNIEKEAFYGNTKLTSITTPCVGASAFYGCSNLTSVTLSESVTSIGTSAFNGCTALTSVTIPESVTNIGNSAFFGCSGLTSVTLKSDINVSNAGLVIKKDGIEYAVLNKNSVKFYRNYMAPVYYSGDIVIPASITAGNTFAVVGILANAFKDCTGLTSVTLPESVTSIGENAFSGCTGLTSITIPESVTSIDVLNANIYVTKDGIKYHVLDNNSVEVVSNNYSGDIVIPASITAGNTFAVVNIEKEAFYCNTKLTSITTPCVGASAFYGCSNLTSVTLSESVTNIGASAFEGCSCLTSVTIPESVTSIGDYAFNRCSGLISITIPETVTNIGASTFKGCSGLTSVTLPESVTSIGEDAFSDCSNLTSIIIPNSVVDVKARAFANCTKLKELTIGANCNSIGENAFSGCSRLIDVTCYAEEVPLANSNSFANYNGYLYIPCEYVRYYKADNIFRRFANISCIPSNDSELQKDDVEIVPEINNALFSMPKNQSANSYTLTIQNNGVTFCTLTFNAQGQLANIDFSTTKSYELKAGISAFQFTVTGLSSATKYGYSFKALSSSKSVLKEYTGSFITKNADGTGGSSTAINGVSNATTVAIVGNQILVNGEAPAFVVTVSGQKIANQNLKAGVYFVNVEGETVKVSVK